jgi:hypothetical protein
MMALLKNDIEVKRAVQGSKDALDDNSRALQELLESIYGVGSVAKERIAKLCRGNDGPDDPSGL